MVLQRDGGVVAPKANKASTPSILFDKLKPVDEYFRPNAGPNEWGRVPALELIFLSSFEAFGSCGFCLKLSVHLVHEYMTTAGLCVAQRPPRRE